MANPVDPDDLLDSSALAEFIGLSSAGAVRVYRSRYKDFPQPRVDRGRCVLWDRADVEAWLDSRDGRPAQ